MPNNRCNGIVTNHFPGISMVEYHHDAQVCVRPGPRDLPLGTLVESEFQIQLGLCEHTIVAVHEFAPQSDEQQPKVTTFKDEPVSEDVIKRASIPPKIRVNLSTIPEAKKARIAAMSVGQTFEFNLDPEELAELNQIHVSEEPISGSAPVNPFDPIFSASPKREPAQGRKAEKPVSVFDL